MTTDSKPSMHIDPYERGWIIATIIMLVIFLVAVTIAGFAMGIQVPAPAGAGQPPDSRPGRTVCDPRSAAVGARQV